MIEAVKSGVIKSETEWHLHEPASGGDVWLNPGNQAITIPQLHSNAKFLRSNVRYRFAVVLCFDPLASSDVVGTVRVVEPVIYHVRRPRGSGAFYHMSDKYGFAGWLLASEVVPTTTIRALPTLEMAASAMNGNGTRVAGGAREFLNRSAADGSGLILRLSPFRKGGASR